MKIVLALAAGLLLCCCCINRVEGLMELDFFKKVIANDCYGRDENKIELPNGQRLPVPNTIEAFISLVEKVESRTNNKWKMEELLKVLLVSFRYDDIVYFSVDNTYRNRNQKVGTAFDILKEVMRNPSKSTSPLTQENVLSQDERCALYFMISHTVNDTARSGDDINRQNVQKQIREQGVVTLGDAKEHAFALGKVLLGLLAGLIYGPKNDIDAQSIYSALTPKGGEDLSAEKIDAIYAATFGDLITLSKEDAKQDESGQINPQFLPNGYWYEPNCAIDYILPMDDTNPEYYKIHTTYSSIRGAIDGYVLGKMIQKMQTTFPFIRLSQVLRAYYSREGITDGSESQSWCSRQVNFKNIRQELSIAAPSYDKLFSACTGVTGGNDELIRRNLNIVLEAIERREAEIISSAFRDNSGCQQVSTAECETASDVLAIMDYKADETQLQLQREIIGNLSSGMSVSFYGGSASVYTNLRPNGADQALDTIIDNNTVSGCGGCAARYYDTHQRSMENEKDVIRDLNRTLERISYRTEELPGINSKVVLYFNYGTPNKDDRQLLDAIYELRYYHPDAKILAFGTRKEALKVFVDREETDIDTSTILTEQSIEKLKEKVCKVPAEFQYQMCDRGTDADERNSKYEGFITPGHVQYWAMYPKYYLKSYRIKLIFKVTTGQQLKVCFSRKYEEIFDVKEPRNDLCRDTTGSEGEAVFYERNPCHRYSLENCPRFYFYIKAKQVTSDVTKDIQCRDPRCKTLDQIPFEFRHEGISCNKAYFLNCSVPTIFYAAVAAIAWILSTASG